MFHLASSSFPPAASTLVVWPVHKELQGQEERGASTTGSGAGRRLKGRHRPGSSCKKAAGGWTFVFKAAFCSLGFFCLFIFNPWRVVAGVLQQPRWDVVPQGNDRVLTLRDRPPPRGLHPWLESSSPRCAVRGQPDGWKPITARPAQRTTMSAICSAQNIISRCISDINTRALTQGEG